MDSPFPHYVYWKEAILLPGWAGALLQIAELRLCRPV